MSAEDCVWQFGYRNEWTEVFLKKKKEEEEERKKGKKGVKERK